jgi:isopenicillin-N epimerase
VNVVASSIDFEPGDELLTTNQEYGACENVWDFLASEKGLQVVQVNIPLPLPAKEEIMEMIWSGVSQKTRLIFLSQITSPTAVRLPVEEICQRARDAGIPVLVDGAHAPGQLDLSLDTLGADFYAGNCHKWLLAPKGSGFLYVRPDRVKEIKPLVVSWGWGENCPYQSDTRLQSLLEWWGTKDPAAYLATPTAIQFQKDNNWQSIRIKCRSMLTTSLEEIEFLTGLPSIYGENGLNTIQIGAAEWPADWKPEDLQKWLYDQHRIEIPVIEWNNRWLIRPSVQAYNEEWELERLIEVLEEYRKSI